MDEAVWEIAGEPAIVINGLPPLPTSDTIPPPIANPQQLPCFGKWLEGREVRKLFSGQFFKGTVTAYEEEMGWYQVDYEDGDSEDLELDEVLGILSPLDIHIPLRTIAEKVATREDKPVQKSDRIKVRSRKNGATGKYDVMETAASKF